MLNTDRAMTYQGSVTKWNYAHEKFTVVPYMRCMQATAMSKEKRKTEKKNYNVTNVYLLSKNSRYAKYE